MDGGQRLCRRPTEGGLALEYEHAAPGKGNLAQQWWGTWKVCGINANVFGVCSTAFPPCCTTEALPTSLWVNMCSKCVLAALNHQIGLLFAVPVHILSRNCILWLLYTVWLSAYNAILLDFFILSISKQKYLKRITMTDNIGPLYAAW